MVKFVFGYKFMAICLITKMNSNLFLSLPNTDDLLTILYSPSAFLMNTCYISVEWMNRSLAGKRIDGEKFCFPWKFDKIK